jgi:alkylation response protein AidB-like acyl-CoA dehydrogenase
MANQYMSMETLRFMMYNVHNTEALFDRERYQEYDRETIDIYLDSIKDFSDKELFPYIKEMDEKPAYWKDGTIIVHPQFEKLLPMAGEMGLVGSAFNYEDGGMQLPVTVVNAANFIMECANNHVPGYFGLTAGAAHLLISYATEEIKNTYVPNMVAMKWGGSMCLTEPGAGSSMNGVKTTAQAVGDGRYKIKGQKIFISSGDYNYVDNVVHLVLARTEGAPAGTKGISLFCVPKKRVEANGDLTYNNVYTAAEFEKLGQRGYCTTHLIFGEDGDAYGWLVGEENQGLKCMFQMMNEARIGTGRSGASIATAAYYASLQYANERSQGRKLASASKPEAVNETTPIIQHADVRRMLLVQKAIVEGSLSLIAETSILADIEITSTGEEKENAHLLLELLTPMVKTYPAEKGRESVNNGLQILGGYGYTMDFILQQYLRDIRIIAIYEGTTGIQSLDLLGRKITMKNGKALQLLAAKIQEDIQAAMTYDDLKPYAQTLGANLLMVQETLGFLMPFAMKGEFERFLSDATIFMEFFSTITIGWQWLKIATAAKQALITGKTEYSPAFYESKIHTMRFFYKYEMTKTKSLSKIIMSEDVLTLSALELAFA